MQSALFTDFYELTMAQAFWKNNLNYETIFDMFFRKHPFEGGYSIFSGLEPLLKTITEFRFDKDDIAFLEKQKIFSDEFLNFLADYSFSGNLYAMEEGSLIFPNEPIIRVEAPVIDAMILEGVILNTINFESLIATKTARIWLASNKAPIMEFGLRRAQGYDGAMSASRAAYVGGAAGTSNTLAAKLYDIPAMGTMAHSWVMSFDSEEEAFEKYAELYPKGSVFLIDTYDTLQSGIKNAIKVGKKLQAKGHNFGVRLDSGDLYYLSKAVRKLLDEAGCPNATITASNELTEEIVESLVLNKAPINGWGVGTHMVTGGDESSFTGVYKLAARKMENDKWTPVMKFSDNPAKQTIPGIKQVWRLYNDDGSFKADIIALEDEIVKEGKEQTFYHPNNNVQFFKFAPAKVEPLLNIKIKKGKRVAEPKSLKDIKKYAEKQLDSLDPTSKRILNPHIYKVSLTAKLKKLKDKLILAHLEH
ncbi:MAG: nicotinate phosphoribosyltransferase [Treponemataceae bacterium]